MKENFLIFDNIISKSYLKHLVDNIFDYNWKFYSNLTYGNYSKFVNIQNLEHGFSASLTEEQKYFILPLIFTICDLSNISILDKNQISKIVPRLQTLTSPKNDINDIHLDCSSNHYVIIFYPHNIDGETILYNETTSDLSFSKFNKMTIEEKTKVTKNFSILKKITPKENRALIFNGNRYHSSSSPSKDPRCVININIDVNGEKKINLANYN